MYTCWNKCTEASPQNNMVIVSDYALVEKSAGVFCSVCRSGSLPVLRWKACCYR